MPVNLSTSLHASLDRVLDRVIDVIAKEGLVALKRTLDKSGFHKSEYLKNYDVYAHVKGRDISFEIILDVGSMVPADEVTRKAMEEAQQSAQEEARTYGLTQRGVQRIHGQYDARKDARSSAQSAGSPLKDARSSAKDARRTSTGRLVGHDLAREAPRVIKSPRGAEIDREGKLVVSLKRSMRTVKDQIKMPDGQYQGVVGQFMKELKKVVHKKFSPELGRIIKKHVRTV